MDFSRQEYWNELPFPSPGDHPDSGFEPGSPALQADSLPTEPPGGGSDLEYPGNLRQTLTSGFYITPNLSYLGTPWDPHLKDRVPPKGRQRKHLEGQEMLLFPPFRGD